uniref:Phospho-N-acetylmuramoyl-pentapeptide-transferase n=1 Tax=candidate division WOR-3 bacterium TaxID=2052148 RepID=A0A7C4Y3Y2_UNCW3
MLYYLYLLKDFFFPFNVFRYITFRAFYAALTSLLIVLIFGDRFIRFLKRLNFIENISKYLKETHSQKSGTPSMGGILILISMLFSTILWANITNRFIIYLLSLTLYLGIVGIYDDWTKLKKGDGIRPLLKLILQAIPCIIIGALLVKFPVKQGYGSITSIPFFKNLFINFGYLYLPFIIILVIGMTNAVNLTDGLDGLAIGLSLIMAIAMGIVAYFVGNVKIANYLKILYIENTGEIVVFISAFLGASLGFLWFNCYPAQVFMGDTGSLMIGGIFGLISVILKQEILFLIISGAFIIETISVILQVSSFKLRKKRIFLMAPIHHHFQRKGIPETKIVVRFWIIGIIFAILGLSTLKIR